MKTLLPTGLKPGRLTHLLPSKALLFLLLTVLFVFVATAVAQESDQADLPDDVISIETVAVLPYGVQKQVSILASKDTFISSANPDTNYGSWTTMGLGYASGTYNAMRLLVEFNLTSIPSTAIINKADLNSYLNSSIPFNDSDMGFKAQYMKSSWSESGVTWNNANYLGGTEIGVGAIRSNPLGWVTGDVTELVKRWHSGAQSNYGMILTGDEGPERNRSRWFRTRNWGGYAPYIRVDYTECSDLEPPNATVKTLPTWSPASFEVSWTGTDNGAGIAWYDVQYRIQQGSWVTWQNQTTKTSATFNNAANGQLVEFRARAGDHCGNVQDWTNAQAWTTVDTVPPNVSVNPLPQVTFTSNFIVTWSGSDNGSGIAYYDVQVRTDGGEWINWQNATTFTSAQVTGAKNGSTYEFRARGVDNVGNAQPWSGPQAQTLVAFYPVAKIVPFPEPFTDQSPYEVQWEGIWVTGDLSYKVFYRFNQGSWQDITPNPNGGWTTDTSLMFDFKNKKGNGLYEFEAIAKSGSGQQEPQSKVPEDAIIYNEDGIFFISWYPSIYK